MDGNLELKRRYLSIFDSNIIGILNTGADGEILDANDYFLDLIGYTREDLKARRLNWKALTPPELLKESTDIQEQLRRTPGIAISFEKEYFHKDGHRVPVRLGVTTFEDGTTITLVQDTSQQKEIERKLEEANASLETRVEIRTRELAESEAFLSAIFDNMPNMVFVKDARTLEFVRLNRSGEEMLGMKREDVLGKRDYEIWGEKASSGYKADDITVLTEKRILDIPVEELVREDGIHLLHTRKVPIFDKDGIPRFVLGVSEDITERVHAEKQREVLLQEQVARKAAESRAQQMSFLSDITFAMSKSFDLREILRAFSHKVVPILTDVCIIEIIDEEGMDYAMVEIHADRPEDEEFVIQWRRENPPRWDAELGGPTILRSGKTEIINDFSEIIRHIDENYNLENKNPTETSLFSRAFMTVPLMVRDKKPLGYVGFVSTHPQRKFSEEDKELAEEACRRLATLVENSRLYYRSQDASRAKSSFLANVSHEIRTPLGAMLGFAEILRDDESLTADQRHSVDTVVRNGQQLLRIVNEILDISKVESEKIDIEYIPFSLCALLKDVVHLLKPKAQERGIELRLEAEGLPSTLISDPNRIRQVLINIVGNAVKFTEKGHVLLKARANQLTSNKMCLEFDVIDTGIGITGKQRANLFQAFSQADASTTRRFGGTGLGLFLSRKLARLMGGDIVLKSSTAGQGSHFVVSMLARIPNRKMTLKSQVAQTPHKVESSGDGFIMVVDDASDNRELFKRYLIKSGISEDHIEMAENGEEALRKADNHDFRLILMDIQMPQMDGFQTLKELRAHGYHGPVVALTAHAMKGDREKCLNAGFDDYLQKPLKKEALQEVLNKDFR